MFKAKSKVLGFNKGAAVVIPTTDKKWDLHINNAYAGRFDSKSAAIKRAKKALS